MGTFNMASQQVFLVGVALTFVLGNVSAVGGLETSENPPPVEHGAPLDKTDTGLQWKQLEAQNNHGRERDVLIRTGDGVKSGHEPMETTTFDDDCPKGCSCSFSTVTCFGTLDSIPPKFPPDTTRLVLYYNNFTSVPSNAFPNLDKLEYLMMPFGKVGFIENGAFSGLGSVILLNLSTNSIDSLISTAFTGLENLQSLDLVSNKIDSFADGAFEPLKKLKFLLITPVSSQYPYNAFNSLVNLETLYVQDGRFAAVPGYAFSRMKKLSMLIIADNPNLTTIHPDAFAPGTLNESLTSIDLNHCNLREIPSQMFRYVQSLRSFTVSNNPIGQVDDNAFADLPNLQYLNLQGLGLAVLPKGAFNGLDSIQSIYMDTNNLVTLTPDHFSSHVNTLKTMTLSDNPWHCDCDLWRFNRWLHTETNITVYQSLICASPEQLKGQQLDKITATQAGCP
ncbi:CHADL [Branchiostoma lanceolatum]|uniref:CHADL protein n=1 Tax=Branchiostoma lanceolatum TaxID=7740 RepID=A0A8J9YMA8_BRALA|nr:CHADL [Branchiostoma lanceolatum]